MSLFLAYHCVPRMHAEFQAAAEFSFRTAKAESLVRRALGQTVWVIVGRRELGVTRYRLAGRFTPSRLERSAGGWIISGPSMAVVPQPDRPMMAEVRTTGRL